MQQGFYIISNGFREAVAAMGPMRFVAMAMELEQLNFDDDHRFDHCEAVFRWP